MARVNEALLTRWFGGRFVWGERDCCASACSAFAEIYGFDPMVELRGLYASRREAHSVIADRGGLRLVAMDLARKNGLVWRQREPARGGDIALIGEGKCPSLGLAIGNGWFAAKGPKGLVVVGHALECWGPA